MGVGPCEGKHTRLVQAACTRWDLARQLDLLRPLVFLQFIQGRVARIALIGTPHRQYLDPFSSIGPLHHTSGTDLIRRRSRGGSCITSVFSLCSAASPDVGLDTTDGLSLAETQLATP